MGFLNNLINGISLGSIYAVIALGYTLVYGIAKMLNFAHGDVIMVGGYVIFTCMTTWGLNSWLSIVLAVIACTLLGIVIEKVAYKPLRQATSLAVLITAIGVSYFLQNTALLIFGEKPVNFTSVVNVPSIKLFDGQIVISGETSVAIIVSILIVVGLSLFINKTKSGRAMLAVSEDRGAAQLMGVNINRTISLTFAIGSGLAAIAGALLCSAYPTLQNTTGAMPGISVRCGGIWRYRLNTGRYDRRYPYRCYRDTWTCLYLTAACRRYRFCCSYTCAYHQAYRYPRQEDKRKGIKVNLKFSSRLALQFCFI